MRVLVTTQPGMGHFRPLVPLANALVARGHEVIVACAERFRPQVEREGHRAVAAGYDFVMAEASRAFADMPPAGPARMPWMIPFFYRRTAVRTATDLDALVATVAPDLVVRDYLELGGALFAEKHGIPHVVAGPVWFRGEPTVMESLRDACADVGLAKDRAEGLPFRHGAFAALPRRWVADDEHVPPGIHFVRPEPPPSSGTTEDWRARVDERLPLVHVTLGTTEANRTPGLYRVLVDAIRDEPVSCVVSVGRPIDPGELGPPAPRVHAYPFVDHGALLPRCAAVVSNGGHGTIMASLAAGVPSVIVPLQADQPRNARRAAELGFAEVVGREERTAERVREAIRAVLSEPRYAARAREMRDEIAALAPVESHIETLEALASSRR